MYWSVSKVDGDDNIDPSLPICRHQYLDISSRVETIELVNQFQHRPLDFIIASCAVVESCASDSIDFIEEDDARLLAPGHLEQFTHHTGTFTDILLYEFRANDTNESRIRSVGHCTRTESFASTWWAEQKDALWWIDTEINEPLGLWDKSKHGRYPVMWTKPTERRGVSTTSRSFSICSLQPPTSEYVTSGFSSTCIMVTEASIFGGSGI